MTNENVNMSRGPYTIDRKLQPYNARFPYMLEENKLFAEKSRTAEDVSHKLLKLYYEVSNRDALKTILEEKLKQAQGVFKNDAEIEVIVTLGLNNGISFNTSGDFENAYDSLNPKLKELYSKRSNPEIREALKSLVYNGLVIEARFDERSVLVGSSNVDPYFNGNRSLLNKLIEFARTKK